MEPSNDDDDDDDLEEQGEEPRRRRRSSLRWFPMNGMRTPATTWKRRVGRRKMGSTDGESSGCGGGTERAVYARELA